MIPGSVGAWYWPGSAVVSGNTMLVFACKLVPANGPPGFDWQVHGTAVAQFALPSLQLISGPVNMPLRNAPNGVPIPWGIRSFLNAADGKVYLYGTTKFSAPVGPAADAWLARAPFNNPTQLEYFTNPITVTPATPERSTNIADAKPMTFNKFALGDDGPPLAQLSVVPDGNRFLAGAFAADVFQDNLGRSFVWAWQAASPRGPWQKIMNGTNPQIVATFQKRSPDQIAYDARIPQLPGAGWTVVYSANDPIRQQNDFTLYRGQFAAPNGFPPP